MKRHYTIIAYLCRACILFGLASAVYIYVFNFKNISETDMIFWAPFWVMPIVVGYYGLVANNALHRKTESKVDKVSNVVFEIVKEGIGGWAIPFIFLLHLPFLIIKNKSVLLTAFVGALVWAIALHLFLAYIFPYL